jgi:predicted amidophosphoribosyltransferase
VLLLDDLATTGATVAACAAAVAGVGMRLDAVLVLAAVP